MTVSVPIQVATNWRRQVRLWSRATPGWLRIASVAAAAATVLTAFLAASVVAVRQHAIAASTATAEPLVVDAQLVDLKMSDADAAIASAFLAGPVVPAVAQARFQSDLAQVSAALLAASQRAGTQAEITTTLRTLTSGVATYAAIIATAEADNRQGFPVAAAYLSEADHFMRTALLPAAAKLYDLEGARLANDESRAKAARALVLVGLVLIGTVALLLLVQRRLSRRFRRTFNLPWVASTVLVALLGGWVFIGAVAEGRAVAAAARRGTQPLGVLTRARIDFQQAQADDELTLDTRDANPTYQKDFDAVAPRLTALLGAPGRGWTDSELLAFQAASARWADFQQAHSTIRGQDSSGDLSTAIKSEQATAVPVAAQGDAAFQSGVDASVASLDGAAQAARTDLWGLPWGLLVLAGLAAAGVIIGTEPRIREYQ